MWATHYKMPADFGNKLLWEVDKFNKDCTLLQTENWSMQKHIKSKHLNSESEVETQGKPNKSWWSQRTCKMSGHLKDFLLYE